MKKTAKQIAAEILRKMAQTNQVKTLPRKTNPIPTKEGPSTPNAGEPA